ncbi:hypothetical protein J5N97_030226 [Dioscorea zingiberensis]|uniref:Uncharacterized protein n=1 Tax=Dioscorea zingiberensis TaxID=325984 RepID=A0A9D5BX75_9LILI|nr:hypothetical protein J5N97_030226 [Dioscorea zingiberensis]
MRVIRCSGGGGPSAFRLGASFCASGSLADVFRRGPRPFAIMAASVGSGDAGDSTSGSGACSGVVFGNASAASYTVGAGSGVVGASSAGFSSTGASSTSVTGATGGTSSTSGACAGGSDDSSGVIGAVGVAGDAASGSSGSSDSSGDAGSGGVVPKKLTKALLQASKRHRNNPPTSQSRRITMTFLFGNLKTPTELLRESKRTLDQSIERERQGLQAQEKKLIVEIKKTAKQGPMGVVKVMAKDLVRTRNQITKFYALKSQLQDIEINTRNG